MDERLLMNTVYADSGPTVVWKRPSGHPTSRSPVTTSILPRDLSPTSLDRYRSCPRRFLWQDVEQLPVDAPPTLQQLLGTAVHRALETFFRHEPEMRTYEVLEASLVRAWRRITASRPLESDLERANHLERGRALLQTFVTSFDLAARPLRLEQALELRLRNSTRIRTRLDRIDPWGEGVRVVDYKTGKLQLDSRDIARDTASIIHLLAAEHAGYRVERLSFLYLSTGEEVYWEPERDDVDFAAERLRDLLRTVRDDLEFPAVPGAMCGFCPFRDRCDAAKLPEPGARRTLRPLDALGSKHAQ